MGKKYAWVLLSLYTIFLGMVMYFGVVKYAVLLFGLSEEIVIKALSFSVGFETFSHIATVGVFALSIYMWRDARRESKFVIAMSMVEKAKAIFEGVRSYYLGQYEISHQVNRVNSLISEVDESRRVDLVIDMEVVLRAYLKKLNSEDFFDREAIVNPLKGNFTGVTIDVDDGVLREAVLRLALDVYQYGIYKKTQMSSGDGFLYWIKSRYSADVGVLTKLILQAHPILQGGNNLEKDGYHWRKDRLNKLCLGGEFLPPFVVAFLYLHLSEDAHSIFSQIEKLNE